MAYQNINFPTMKLIHGFTTERIAPTTIVSNFAKEYRINRFSTPKLRFTFPERNLSAADWATLQNFMTTVAYQRDSFNFTPPGAPAAYKVRFDTIPVATVAALNANNTAKIITISEFSLIQVFNE